MTIAEALAEGKARLAESAGEYGSPALDAALLLAEVLGTGRSRLPLLDREEIPAEILLRYRSFTGRRAGGEPAAYILGRKEFRGLCFTVNPSVLIPRPDTEALVEAALEFIDGWSGGGIPPRRVHGTRLPPLRGDPPPVCRILDLCTGSGAVAVSLKHERPGLAVYASDISGEALAVARENARRLLGAGDAHGPEAGRERAAGTGENAGAGAAPVLFLEGDLFEYFPVELRGAFSLIAANPPYIERGAIPGLEREVRREPGTALDGGEDGLDIIRRIIAEAPEWLAPGGGLLIEADPAKMRTIAGFLETRGFRDIQCRRDLAGRERTIGGKT